MLAYVNCRMLTNALWEPTFKLEMFVSSFHQFCLLVISWICLTLGSSTAWVEYIHTHTLPWAAGTLPAVWEDAFFLWWGGTNLTSHPEQHSQAAGEFWSIVQTVWRSSLPRTALFGGIHSPSGKKLLILVHVFSPAPHREISWLLLDSSCPPHTGIQSL